MCFSLLPLLIVILGSIYSVKSDPKLVNSCAESGEKLHFFWHQGDTCRATRQSAGEARAWETASGALQVRGTLLVRLTNDSDGGDWAMLT